MGLSIGGVACEDERLLLEVDDDGHVTVGVPRSEDDADRAIAIQVVLGVVLGEVQRLPVGWAFEVLPEIDALGEPVRVARVAQLVAVDEELGVREVWPIEPV
jgi:hypothetical protein